jgi:hypothetical protein
MTKRWWSTAALALVLVLGLTAAAETQGHATYTIDVPNRQYMEAVRDALYLWEQDPAHGAALAPGHPMKVFVQGLREDIGLKFVGRRAGDEW